MTILGLLDDFAKKCTKSFIEFAREIWKYSSLNVKCTAVTRKDIDVVLDTTHCVNKFVRLRHAISQLLAAPMQSNMLLKAWALYDKCVQGVPLLLSHHGQL